MGKVLTNWKNLPPDFHSEDWAGFVYLIVNTLTQQKYIGRKYLNSVTRRKVKGKKRKKVTRKESDWQTYKSSSDTLKADIKKHGQENFEFIVLSLHETRAATNYHEVREQFARDVLYSKLPNGEFEYYNICILSRYWRKLDE